MGAGNILLRGKPYDELASHPGGHLQYSQLLHATETGLSSGRVGLSLSRVRLYPPTLS